MHQVIRPMDLLQMIMEFSLTWVHAGSEPTGLCTLAASLVACPAQCVRPNVQLGGYVVLNAVYHIPYIAPVLPCRELSECDAEQLA